ncbi:MAG: hypothetical protein M1365_10175 [Actinobacteria bacterium]|nr:hypothetical protein [Actinomycetota bacterium]
MIRIIKLSFFIFIILMLSAVPVCSAQCSGFISANPVFATTGMPAPTVTSKPEPEISKPKGAHEYHHHGSSEAAGSESFDEFFETEYENQPWRIDIFPGNLFWAGIAMLIFNAGMALALWEMKKKKRGKADNQL